MAEGTTKVLHTHCFLFFWRSGQAHQAPPSLGFSRQEHWSGLPFPSPMHEVKSESEVAQSCPTLSDPMACSLLGSSVPGIFQAGVLEWGATARRFYSPNNAVQHLSLFPAFLPHFLEGGGGVAMGTYLPSCSVCSK